MSMASDVFTKGEILQNLAQKGYFIDSYTLDTFLKKWKVEAIFEDEQGSEFYDKNTLDLVLNNLFNQEIKEEQEAAKDILIPTHESAKEVEEEKETLDFDSISAPTFLPEPNINQEAKPKVDKETKDILSNISLSDGTPLINKIPDIPIPNNDLLEINEIPNISLDSMQEETPPKKEKKMGILEGAMISAGQEYKAEEPQKQGEESQENGDFDDISLLSESLEAQEKFKEYVISEMRKKNVDLSAPSQNEFKLDVSARTINMVAKTMAKKIAKYVNDICSQDAKASVKLASVEEENKKLEKRAKELEEQNKKLRLLLAESNKNLNSYKPSVFGLYKKVPPKS